MPSKRASNRSPSKVRHVGSHEATSRHFKGTETVNASSSNFSITAAAPTLPESVRSSIPKSVAWPTVALTVGSCIGHLLVCYSFVKYFDYIRPWQCAAAVIINTYFVYLLFTVMHDSCHGSIKFGDYRWINDAFGLLCAFFFAIPYYGFKYCHLNHHKYTNDPEKDPDHWISFKYSYLLLPFQCMTVEFKYYSVFLPLLPIRPPIESFLCVFQVVVLVALFCSLNSIGLGREALLIWILPGRLAISILAYVFDYLPHHPHRYCVMKAYFHNVKISYLVLRNPVSYNFCN